MKRRQPSTGIQFYTGWTALQFLAPCIIFVILFMLFPLVYSFVLSLTDYHFIFNRTADFIGLQNYFDLHKDPSFVVSLYNTFRFSLLFVPAMVFGSLFIAILLENTRWWQAFFRSAVFLPVIVSLALAGVMFRWILADRLGILNHILRTIGLGTMALNWLGSHDLSLLSLVIVSLWKQMGLPVIMYLAGLGNIDTQLYESADVDGASFVQKIFHITIPNLKQSFIVVGIWSIVQSFKVFEVSFILTEGGPGNSSLVLYLYSWRQSFDYFKMGYGSAAAYFLGFIILALSAINMRSLRDNEND